jgi:hypothetical protein
MPYISQMKTSKFLSRGDCAQGPILGTMLNVSQENVAKEGADDELKWCLHFSNIEKPLVLNQINMQLIAKIAGSENTDDWTGKQIVIFDDPSVSFGGKITGGLRVRAPKIKTPPSVPPAPRPAAHAQAPAPGSRIYTPNPVAPTPAPQPEPEEDDIPF